MIIRSVFSQALESRVSARDRDLSLQASCPSFLSARISASLRTGKAEACLIAESKVWKLYFYIITESSWGTISFLTLIVRVRVGLHW